MTALTKTEIQETKNQTVFTPAICTPKSEKKRSSRLLKIGNTVSELFKKPDLTLKQWERLERMPSQNSSHERFIYLQGRGF